MSNILVATDLSLRSERAVRRAFALARETGAALHLLSVVDDELPEAIAGRRRAETREELERFCAALPDSAHCGWSVEAALGDPVPFQHKVRHAGLAEMLAHGDPGLTGADNERIYFLNGHGRAFTSAECVCRSDASGAWRA